ncbi:hypothetical protein LJC23_04140 [Desulfovibrio sp. OttesenSCG-928-I05]|nr:hypothetical protein [Desulfovibrio sp. OttesenSCG-928-I05]
MNASLPALAKAVAILYWADEKVSEEEWLHAPGFFEKYGFAWPEAKAALEAALENLLDADDDGEDFEESEEELHFGVLDFGAVDFFDVLKDLAGIALLDGVISFKEIELIHAIAKACNENDVVASAALLHAVKEHGARFELE